MNMPSETSSSTDNFIQINWQSGVSGDAGVNGCRPESVLQLVWDRLEGFQGGMLACTENEVALKHLKLAIQALDERRMRRTDQGVFHTSHGHSSRSEDHHDDFSATGA